MNRRLLRRRIATRAGHRCEYCKLHDFTQLAAFHLDHIVPLKLGGDDSLKNRCYLCIDCNLRKADLDSIASVRDDTHLRLFNPRVQNWIEHFEWKTFRLRGLTILGKAMISHFGFNSAKRIRIRKLESELGLFPP